MQRCTGALLDDTELRWDCQHLLVVGYAVLASTVLKDR
jgi:hypothetical protein